MAGFDRNSETNDCCLSLRRHCSSQSGDNLPGYLSAGARIRLTSELTTFVCRRTVHLANPAVPKSTHPPIFCYRTRDLESVDMFEFL